MKKILAGFLLICFTTNASAQLTRYIIQFTNKGGSAFSLTNPSAYLSASSMERRARHNIALDSTDLPVNPAYIDSLRLSGDVTILNVSKWLNSVSIQTTDAAALQKIASFSFVKKSTPVAPKQTLNIQPAQRSEKSENGGYSIIQQTTETPFDYGTAAAQINIHNGAFLHNLGLRGKNMRIGMLDAGYCNYTRSESF